MLLPIARQYDADLYLSSGEISDTLLWRMAKDGAADGRPFVVFVVADCDPSGYQMAVSIGRKLQAFRDLSSRNCSSRSSRPRSPSSRCATLICRARR